MGPAVIARVAVIRTESEVDELTEADRGQLVTSGIHIAGGVALEAEEVAGDLAEEPVEPLRLLHMCLDRQREHDVVQTDLVGIEQIDVPLGKTDVLDLGEVGDLVGEVDLVRVVLDAVAARRRKRGDLEQHRTGIGAQIEHSTTFDALAGQAEGGHPRGGVPLRLLRTDGEVRRGGQRPPEARS